jgi:cell division protein FtsB
MFDSDKLISHIPGLSLFRVVVITSLFVLIYCGFTITGNIARSYQLDRQTLELQKAIAADQAEYAQLSALKQYMQTDRFIEEQAREEGLAMPGDTAIDVSAPASTGPTQSEPAGAWWEKYFTP